MTVLCLCTASCSNEQVVVHQAAIVNQQFNDNHAPGACMRIHCPPRIKAGANLRSRARLSVWHVPLYDIEVEYIGVVK